MIEFEHVFEHFKLVEMCRIIKFSFLLAGF